MLFGRHFLLPLAAPSSGRPVGAGRKAWPRGSPASARAGRLFSFARLGAARAWRARAPQFWAPCARASASGGADKNYHLCNWARPAGPCAHSIGTLFCLTRAGRLAQYCVSGGARAPAGHWRPSNGRARTRAIIWRASCFVYLKGAPRAPEVGQLGGARRPRARA